jgi:hypothetical protein
MHLSHRLAILATAMLAIAFPGAGSQAATATYACPLALGDKAGEKVPAGWWRGERHASPVEAQYATPGKLSEIWVVAGRRGDEEAEAPAILVPDGPDGSWDLSGETDGVLIVCIYGKTNGYYATALPAGIKSCLASGEFNDKTYTLSSGRVTCQ